MKDNGFSVLIAACDSFRAGAVEQLKRHCAALDVPLYQQGYAKDPVTIAADAIKKAKEDSIDVVLIDTAGRMQNNQALMQQLARLVAVNKPDLVLFVGEALVGNDGVDQLVEFDRRLVDHAVDSASPRRIDGIVLTKFDTVDDKVGAALSMVMPPVLLSAKLRVVVMPLTPSTVPTVKPEFSKKLITPVLAASVLIALLVLRSV